MVILGKNIELNICIFFIFVDGIELFVFDFLKDIDFLFG